MYFREKDVAVIYEDFTLVNVHSIQTLFTFVLSEREREKKKGKRNNTKTKLRLFRPALLNLREE